MKKRKVILVLLAGIILFSCNNDDEIFSLLNSNETDDVIKGAYLAGESKKEKFIPLLLKDIADVRTSTNLKFKGYNIYQEKAIALGKIFGKQPSVKITNKPDSLVIKFYRELSQ